MKENKDPIKSKHRLSDSSSLRLRSKLQRSTACSFDLEKVRLPDRRRESHAGIKEIISIPTLLCLAVALFHQGAFGSPQPAQLAALLMWSVLCKYKHLLYRHEQPPWVA